jgi:hypothetical protein
LKATRTEGIAPRGNKAGINIIGYKRNGYRIILPVVESNKHDVLLTQLFKDAYQ